MQNLQSYTDDFYNTIRQKVDNMRLVVKTFNPDNLELQFRTIEQPLLARFDNAKVALLQNMDIKLKDTKQHVQMCMQILESASPQTILARGYSMVRDKTTQEIVRDASQTAAGAQLEIVPAKGKITAQVLTIEKD